MLTAKLENLNSLEEFYKEIRTQQEEAHGMSYCFHHDAIKMYLGEGDRYKELGTHQGATAAAATLQNPASVELIDWKMEKYRPNSHLFEQYCTENNIELSAREMDSTSQASVSECDVMLIDSNHRAAHLTKELKIHASSVTKYIIFHDTHAKPELYEVIQQFVKNNPWKIIQHVEANVGYTVIKRT